MTQAPTEKQIRMMHFVNLISLAYTDQAFDPRESSLLNEIANRLELTQEEMDNCIAYWKQTDEADIPIAVPENDDDREAYMYDFMTLLYADGDITEEDIDHFRYIAKHFGLEEAIIDAYIDSAKEMANRAEDDNTEEEEEEQDDNDEEEDELFEDVYESQIDAGKSDLSWKNIGEAFDDLFLPCFKFHGAYEYFHIIPGIDTRLRLLSKEQIELVRKVAEKGYALAYYVMGRYHQVLKPEEDSLEKAQQYLEGAANAGIADAQWALAMHYLRGYMGPIDMNHFNEFIQEAIDNGSAMALRQRISDMIQGTHGQKSEPKRVIALIDNFLEQDDENEERYPYMHALLGDAYHKIGNKDKADECYEKAEDLGYYEANSYRFDNRVEGPDKNFYRETFSFLLSFADEKDSRSLLLQALESAYQYDTDGPSRQETNAQKIRENLEQAYQLGEGDAAYYLGLYHYEGKYGFEQSNREAWEWFSKGQDMESGKAFGGMARMIMDGVKPSSLPDNYLEYLLLCAVRRDDKTMLPALVEAYKAGNLKGLENEVESIYIPMLNETHDDSGIPTVILVTPEGKATIYKVEKAEWNKMPTLVGAKRLAPICMDAIETLGKKAGLTDRLTAWIDIDAPRKGLPVNAIASKLYQGVIAGDVVFTMTDKSYEEMPFFGIDEAKAVIQALGAELNEVVTDLSQVKPTERTHADYSKVNPKANLGYVARIEPDGSAHLVNSSLGVFALFEEDIYDPQRLQSLYDLGTQLGLKGRLTLWTDHDALRKHQVFESMAPENPIGTKHYPGFVASNLFVALEDEQYRILLFDDAEQLAQVCEALGVKKENISIDK